MTKTPEYTKRAVNNYREKFDFIQVRFPKGTKEKLKEVGDKNSFIVNCVLSALDKSEKAKASIKPEKLKKSPEPQKTPEICELYEIYKDEMHEFITQLQIQEKYGNETLIALSEYAQNKEDKDS